MVLFLLACTPSLSTPVLAPVDATYEHWLTAVPDEVGHHDGRYWYEDLVQLPPDTLAATLFARTSAASPTCVEQVRLGAESHDADSSHTIDGVRSRMLVRHDVAPTQLRHELALYVAVDTLCEPDFQVEQLDVFVRRGAVR